MQTTTTYDKCLLANLLTNRQYAEALQYIDSLNVKKNRVFSREDIAHLYFAQGQCLYRLGNYRRAVVKVRCSIWLSDSLNDNLLYARQKYTLGQIYHETGRLEEALAEYTESHAFFKRVRDRHRMLMAMTLIALIHFQKGDCQRAIEVNESVMREARLYALPPTLRTAALNLCRVLVWTGEFAKGFHILNSVESDCVDALSCVWLESIRGMFYVRLLDSPRARQHFERAWSGASANGYRRDEVVCMEYLGLNEFYAGNYAEARNYYQQILTMPEITASAMAQTLRLLTDVQVALGELDKAAETAVKAEAAITNIKEWVELGCLHRALAQLADKRRDAQLASDHFSKSIEILTRHGARYELAVTYLAAGAAGCLDVGTKKARLQQAKALFSEMDVPKRVSQVEKAILQLTSIKPQPKVFRTGKSSIETPDIIAQNPEMLRILAEAKRFADTDMTVLITGETGTGKDLLAKYIHCHSRRAAGPFCNENMSRFPRELIDSELFGYEKGSHSRADRNRAGLIELADGGTFCLNEVAELPLDLQTRLLQVIEEGTVRRVGGGEPRRVDVRFIAMTNQNLPAMVKSGHFRNDLFYRLQGLHLHLPPLRARTGDLPLLLQHFLKQLGFRSFDLRETTLIVEHCGCDRYDWPGNIRQLERVLGRTVLLTPSRLVAELVPRLTATIAGLSAGNADESERARLTAALSQSGGNIAATARELNISRSRLRRLMNRHGIH